MIIAIIVAVVAVGFLIFILKIGKWGNDAMDVIIDRDSDPCPYQSLNDEEEQE
jgi:hypothetical protein